jgi:hypothetical protein
LEEEKNLKKNKNKKMLAHTGNFLLTVVVFAVAGWSGKKRHFLFPTEFFLSNYHISVIFQVSEFFRRLSNFSSTIALSSEQGDHIGPIFAIGRLFTWCSYTLHEWYHCYADLLPSPRVEPSTFWNYFGLGTDFHCQTFSLMGTGAGVNIFKPKIRIWVNFGRSCNT